MDQPKSLSHLKISSDVKAGELKEKIHQMTQHESEEVLKARALAQGLGYVNLHGRVVVEECYLTIPQEDAQRLQVVCFDFQRHHAFKVATTSYTDETKTYLERRAHELETPLSIYLTSPESLKSALHGYARIPKVIPTEEVLLTPEQISASSEALTTLAEFSNKLVHASTSDAMAMLVAAALKFQSSDIHIEDERDSTAVRFRIDGVLHPVAVIDKHLGKQLISRIKLMSGLKINISDRPQDGHFDIKINSDKVDARVSAVPTNYGESMALRILESTAKRITFDSLGMFSWTKAFLEREIVRPAGLFVVCGPTGSGKTTSLYSILLRINTPGVKILTIEDPIEYEIKGVSQSQVDIDKRFTFAKGLRSLVRQDPDVIMIGEIRDAETVDIALQAALTGHLVFSTLHSNSSSGAIPRFLAMGAKPYLLAPALNAVMSQRLVRKLCSHCKKETEPSAEQRAILERALPSVQKHFTELSITEQHFYTSAGCEKCGGLGYSGRVGIFEHLLKTELLEKEILASALSEGAVREIQHAQLMITMLEDGILKSLLGITSLEEILRVVDVETMHQ